MFNERMNICEITRKKREKETHVHVCDALDLTESLFSMLIDHLHAYNTIPLFVMLFPVAKSDLRIHRPKEKRKGL